MDVAARADAGRIHVPVGVHPKQADTFAVVPGARGRGHHRTGGQTVIAAQDDGHRAASVHGKRRIVQTAANLRDVFDVLPGGIARTAKFPDGRGKIAPVRHRSPQGGNAFAHAGDAHGGWPHVDAAASRTEVEGHSDNVDRMHWRISPVRAARRVARYGSRAGCGERLRDRADSRWR